MDSVLKTREEAWDLSHLHLNHQRKLNDLHHQMEVDRQIQVPHYSYYSYFPLLDVEA